MTDKEKRIAECPFDASRNQFIDIIKLDNETWAVQRNDGKWHTFDKDGIVISHFGYCNILDKKPKYGPYTCMTQVPLGKKVKYKTGDIIFTINGVTINFDGDVIVRVGMDWKYNYTYGDYILVDSGEPLGLRTP